MLCEVFSKLKDSVIKSKVQQQSSCWYLETSDPPGVPTLCWEEKQHPACPIFTLVFLLHPYSILGYSHKVATFSWIFFSSTCS